MKNRIHTLYARTGAFVTISVMSFFDAMPAWAAGIPKPTFGGSDGDLLSAFKTLVKDYGSLALLLIFIISFIVVASSIMGAFSEAKQKGWGQFGGSLVGGLIALAVIGYILYLGQQAIDNMG